VSKEPKQPDKGEQLALPGVPLEARQAVWREHTAERWERDDPDAYAECIEAIRNGETNKTHLKNRFGVSRNTVLALMMKEFSVEQLQTINAKRAAITVGESLSRTDELVVYATEKELGALAMVSKTAFDMAQLGSGGPTEVVEHRHLVSVEEFTREVGPGTGLEAGKVLALPPGPLAGSLPGAAALPEAREVELVPLGDTQSRPDKQLTRSIPSVMPVVVLLFVPVLAWLVAGGAWDRPVARCAGAGLLNRGGGGQGRAERPISHIHSAAGNFTPLPLPGLRSRLACSVPVGC
jgi:hypothetical protein